MAIDFEGRLLFCPWGHRSSYELDQTQAPKLTIKDDDIVLAKLIKQKRGRDPKASLVSKLGHITDPSVDSKLIQHEFGLAQSFSDQALKLSKHPPTEDPCAALREDLTDLPFVTIDGEDAKDFDDAVFMDAHDHLWVAIADVSYYVQTGTALDIEACERGNSYYFPDCVLPMLPETLSNGACSLRPHEKRMAMVVQIDCSDPKRPQLVHVKPAIIESKARLTYKNVQEMLDGAADIPVMFKDSILKLSKHTAAWRGLRLDHGAIDFDLPEVKYTGQTLEPIRVDRLSSHQLIEECMLMANKVTSKWVFDHDYPNVYRVHEPPNEKKCVDAVEHLHQLLHTENRFLTPKTGKDIGNILEALKDHPLYTHIQYLFLRTMAQACYATEKLGHFGLGFEYYSHFTSPIRRYADLVFHRIIKCLLLKEPPSHLFPKPYGSLNNVCVHISKQDRNSLLVEREIKKIKGIRYMQTQIDETFEGVVSGALRRGMFIETKPFGIEGFISAEHLRTRGFKFSEATQDFRNPTTVLAYGSQLDVQVMRANLFKRQLDFDLV